MGDRRIFLKIYAPLSFINTYQMNLISAGSISLDNTFKFLVEKCLRFIFTFSSNWEFCAVMYVQIYRKQIVSRYSYQEVCEGI